MDMKGNTSRVGVMLSLYVRNMVSMTCISNLFYMLGTNRSPHCRSDKSGNLENSQEHSTQ